MSDTVMIKTLFLHVVSILSLCCRHTTEGGITDLWDFCGCRWGNWEGWSDCTRQCNGIRYRSRKVWLYTEKDGCPFSFYTCATSDMGHDSSLCNTFCYNGGTSDSYSCSCVTGYYGACCGLEVNCGDPGALVNGKISGSSFTYGSSIAYSCNTGYLLSDGSKSRICQITHTWSGSKPRCAYYDSCSSTPCINSGTCSNIPDDYGCQCTDGWSGKNCEIDIQPPVMSQCSDNLDMRSKELTQQINWTIPSFSDPHNFEVVVTSNYPRNQWTFPWGDFVVSYTARKPSNGLTTECSFQIRVRPNGCEDLSAPINGALVCNDWKKDYGLFCLYLCHKNFTVPRGVDSDLWVVCGASGFWTPTSDIPPCSVEIKKLPSTTGYKIANSYEDCSTDADKIKTYFLSKLKISPFRYFCEKFSNDCSENNVALTCS